MRTSPLTDMPTHHIYVQVITAWGAYISVHLIMLLAIYLLAPNDFVQMYTISP